ncbi:DsbA family protein [Solibacillus silvestris]|uniref:DsbA family protein n=1 Tax=Solibacillus silvestris TaxID=76853 RepID=UPI003F821888
MKIEIFPDFACPFCYIVKTILFQVIEQFNLTEEINIEYKDCELNSNASTAAIFP